MIVFFFFFFSSRRRHTRCYRDWSSDVCSSDLDLPPGQLPHYLDVTVLQDLVDNARPGDRVILTGIVRIEQEHIPSMRGKSGIYRLRVQGNNIEFLGGRGSKTSRSTEREEISSDEEKIIKSLANNPDIYDRLVSSFAPHVHDH